MTIVAILSTANSARDTQDELAMEDIPSRIWESYPFAFGETSYMLYEVEVNDDDAERAGKVLARGWGA
jgi:hypothetical protein